MTAVKICGVTSPEDALLCVDAGADAIGLNFVASSPRRVSVELARRIVQALPSRFMTVGVFVDAAYEELIDIKQRVGLRCLQLHGAESPALLVRCLPHAYKALRVRDASLVEEAARYPGEHLLLDAFVAGVQGGTGASFDWQLARLVAGTRKITLAGGLHPDNVAAAVVAVRPYCVDVASGVETEPGKKDPTLVRAFVTRAKAA